MRTRGHLSHFCGRKSAATRDRQCGAQAGTVAAGGGHSGRSGEATWHRLGWLVWDLGRREPHCKTFAVPAIFPWCWHTPPLPNWLKTIAVLLEEPLPLSNCCLDTL